MFIIIWEYRVAEDKEDDFKKHYNPEGSWASLFLKQPGYIGTELIQDKSIQNRFVTIDRWKDEESFKSFKQKHHRDYSYLDKTCEALTTTEKPIGEFFG